MATSKTISDGGYYAIKGFEFQIDKTILEILSSDNENDQVNLEQIQDIDAKSFVIQVKYKEKHKFLPSKIKDPLIQLFEEFRLDSSKSYYLYAYFNNFSGFSDFVDENNQITFSNLERILGNKKDAFTEKEKKDFIRSFYLDFAPTFQDQFEQVLVALKKLSFISSSTDEAIFYYSSIANYLRKLVIENSRPIDRTCTKKQVLNYIKNNKKIIFDSAFKEYKGEVAYFKYVKSRFVKPRRNQENLIIIGNVVKDESTSISSLLISIINKYFRGAVYDIKPLTFIIDDEIIDDVKRDLISDKVVFNDGFEHILFSEDIFFKDPVKNKKMASNGRGSESLGNISYNVRILSLSKFEEIINYKIMPKIMYCLDTEIPEKFESIPFVKVEGLNSKQINDLFIF